LRGKNGFKTLIITSGN